MALTLAEYKVRVLACLMDSGAAIWTEASGVSAECIRSSLDEYTGANPLAMEDVITCLADGREIALSSLANLRGVHDVWWPYDSTGDEEWPPNRVTGFRLWWDDAQPVLFLDAADDAQPQTGDEVRVFYTVPHTIEDLDSADVTTVPTEHESLLVLGAAGFACYARSIAEAENVTDDLDSIAPPMYGALASRFLREFRKRLAYLRVAGSNPAGAGGSAFGAGWSMDEWDGDNQ